MTTEQKLDLILEKIWNLDNRLWNVEKNISNLNTKVSSLDTKVSSLEKEILKLRDDFYEFKDETNANFEYTNKLIDQAFEKISENIAYQEKVNAIEKILHSRGRNYA